MMSGRDDIEAAGAGIPEFCGRADESGVRWQRGEPSSGRSRLIALVPGSAIEQHDTPVGEDAVAWTELEIVEARSRCRRGRRSLGLTLSVEPRRRSASSAGRGSPPDAAGADRRVERDG